MSTRDGAYKPVFGSGTRLAVRPCKPNTAPMLSVFFEAFLGGVESRNAAGCLVIYV